MSKPVIVIENEQDPILLRDLETGVAFFYDGTFTPPCLYIMTDEDTKDSPIIFQPSNGCLIKTTDPDAMVMPVAKITITVLR